MNKIILLLSITLLFSCSDNKNAETSHADTSHAEVEKHISWFDGTVDEAFAASTAQNKPLFLYWGAVWCPPCQEIKHTVFKSRRFIAQTESFIPVYLDGDTDEAQLMGEKFGVKGYPTMIVFDKGHNEITRIPGGIDISMYNDILALSLNSISPTSTLVERVLANDTSLTHNEIKQLAYYSWGQDQEALPEEYSPKLFLSMSDIAAGLEPADEVSSARFYMQYIYEHMRAEGKKEKAEGEEAEPSVVIEGALQRVNEILDSEKLTLACFDSIAYYASNFLPHIATGKQAEDLKQKWQEKLLTLSTHHSLSTAEKLAGLLPTLDFAFEEDDDEAKLDDAMQQKVIAAVDIANKAAKNSFARQSVVNQMNYILQSAHLMDEAKKLLTDELERSKAPYYFMSSLGSIAEKEENKELALEWRRKAYEASVGNATRFQWGANYVRAMIRLQPENHEAITTNALALFDELDSGEDAFVGRNFRVLRSLNKKLVAYKEENESAVISAFTSGIEDRCVKQTAESIAAKNCQSLSEKG